MESGAHFKLELGGQYNWNLHSWPVREITTSHFEDENFDKFKIKWEDEWIAFDRYYKSPPRYELPDRNYSVYIDGLMLTNITSPEINLNPYFKFQMNSNQNSTIYNSSNPDSFVCPQLIVNIPKPSGMKIDLARTNLDSTIRWDIKIWENLGKYLHEKHFANTEQLDAKLLLLKVGKVMTFYNIPQQLIMEKIINVNNLPFPFATKDLSLQFNDNLLDKKTIKKLPAIFENDYLRKIESEFYKYKNHKSILDNYEGDLAIYSLAEISHISEFSMTIQNAIELLSDLFKHNYYFSQIEFISSPLGQNYPLVLEIHEKRPDNPTTNLYTKNSIFTEFSNYRWYELHSILHRKFKRFPKLVIFPKPYNDKLFYSFSYMNINHPKTIEVVKIALTILEEDENNNLSKAVIGELMDMMNDLPFINIYYSSDLKFNLDDLNNKIEQFYQVFTKHQVFHLTNNENITINDFVNNSIKAVKDSNVYHTKLSKKKFLKGQDKWGLALQ